MIEQIYTFFTIDMIYIWLTLGVIPFWFMLFFFPQSKICKIFVTSIFPLIILTAANVYLILEIYKTDFNLSESFNLYLSLDELLILFSEKNFIIIFWVHFLAINLFCGSWIVRDYQKINMPRFLAFFPLILTYFIGPLGLCIYWLFRIFYSKRIDLYE
tara:strand:+ start:767 stop:1240 length:474 start_codon:yes stop_codon:yes gene_type:complete